jgi:DNA end-binding protein Ku
VGQRRFGETQVYRLDTHDFRIERVEKRGRVPGWIHGHRAELIGPDAIRIWGGTVVTSGGEREQYTPTNRCSCSTSGGVSGPSCRKRRAAVRSALAFDARREARGARRSGTRLAPDSFGGTRMARAMWKASLELGRLRIPVKLYAAVEERKVHFRLLHAKDHVPVRQRMVDPHTEQEVPSEKIQRGIELEEGVFVVLDEQEREAIRPAPSRAIEVVRVVPSGAVDAAWYDRPYYLGPDGAAADYFALAKTLGDGAQVGIARWTMRNQPYFGALEPREGRLALISLHAADEIVAVDVLGRATGPAISAAERKLGEQLVAALAGPFDPNALHDDYREKVEKWIAAKRQGRRFRVKEAPPPRARGDLGDVLRRSLRAAKGGSRAAA